MEIDSFLDLVKKRRNIRQFKPDPIPDEYVEKILEAARWAMSGANGQPWEFVVVRDAETKAKIAKLGVEHLKRNYPLELSRVEELRHAAYSRPPEDVPDLREAPVIIVVCGDIRTLQATVLAAHFYGEGMSTFHMNLANATQNIHLAAAALGLGSRWMSTSQPLEEGLRGLLGIPTEFRIYAIVPIGYRTAEPAPSYRRELSEIVHQEKYDESKYRSDEDIREFLIRLKQRRAPLYQR